MASEKPSIPSAQRGFRQLAAWYIIGSYALLGHTDLAIDRFGLPEVAFTLVFGGSLAGFVVLIAVSGVRALAGRSTASVPKESGPPAELAPPLPPAPQAQGENQNGPPMEWSATTTLPARTPPTEASPFRGRLSKMRTPEVKMYRLSAWGFRFPSAAIKALLVLLGSVALLVTNGVGSFDLYVAAAVAALGIGLVASIHRGR